MGGGNIVVNVFRPALVGVRSTGGGFFVSQQSQTSPGLSFAPQLGKVLK